jgi:D-sedoheptulose 7-phosphate isomerase
MTPEGTAFLYPFIDGDEGDGPSLLRDLAASAEAKAAESRQLRTATLQSCSPMIDAVAVAMADRFGAGGRLFSFGNGGSATDAAGIAALFRSPPWGLPLPAASLAADEAVITALGNDVGFDLIFSRQLIARSRPGDMVFGLSTSGNSTNLLAAFAEARRRGLLTVGSAGYDGGQMAACADVDHCLVAPAASIHRIQETQAALVFAVWSRVQSLVHEHGDGHR